MSPRLIRLNANGSVAATSNSFLLFLRATSIAAFAYFILWAYWWVELAMPARVLNSL